MKINWPAARSYLRRRPWKREAQHTAVLDHHLPVTWKRKAVVALWWTSKIQRAMAEHGIWAVLCFHRGNISARLEGDRLMSVLQPLPLLSRDTLSLSDRWLFQAWSQTVSNHQSRCTQGFFPQAEQMYLTLKLKSMRMKCNNQNTPAYCWATKSDRPIMLT